MKADFNSRPRVGGDFCHKPERRTRLISIHAPAWGATEQLDDTGVGIAFQFTPPRGGRRFVGKEHNPRGTYFNSRPRVGGDSQLSATQIPAFSFQFTPPRGGRRIRSTIKNCIISFQFTPPRGGRPRRPLHRRQDRRHFNSRPRVGGDSRMGASASWPY